MKIISINKIELNSLSFVQKTLILLGGTLLGFVFLISLESFYELLAADNTLSSFQLVIVAGFSVLLFVLSWVFSSLGNKFSGNQSAKLLCWMLSLAFALSCIFNIVSLFLPLTLERYL